jgi:ribosomal protein S18 acetylase RimI-like enzyme
MADARPSGSRPPGAAPPTVRTAAHGDAGSIATVHVAAWQAAYRGGLLPDAYLDELQVSDRTAAWERTLASPAPPRSARLLAERHGEIVGFCVVGPERGDAPTGADRPARGELHVLNVHPDAWGRGVGAALLAAGTEVLTAAGFDEAVLWVHPDNRRARRFYERAGWQPDDATRTEVVWGVEVPEVRYRRPLGGATPHR